MIKMWGEVEKSSILETRSRVSERVLSRRKPNSGKREVEAARQVQEVPEKLGYRGGSVGEVKKRLYDRLVVDVKYYVFSGKIRAPAEKRV